VTVNAAKALGKTDRGQLEVGLRADFGLYQISQPAELCYQFGVPLLQQLVIGGRIQSLGA
jgi:imidazolonepropionase